MEAWAGGRRRRAATGGGDGRGGRGCGQVSRGRSEDYVVALRDATRDMLGHADMHPVAGPPRRPRQRLAAGADTRSKAVPASGWAAPLLVSLLLRRSSLRGQGGQWRPLAAA